MCVCESVKAGMCSYPCATICAHALTHTHTHKHTHTHTHTHADSVTSGKKCAATLAPQSAHTHTRTHTHTQTHTHGPMKGTCTLTATLSQRFALQTSLGSKLDLRVEVGEAEELEDTEGSATAMCGDGMAMSLGPRRRVIGTAHVEVGWRGARDKDAVGAHDVSFHLRAWGGEVSQ